MLLSLLFNSGAVADLLISQPRVARHKVGILEIGSSPELDLIYRNNTGKAVNISTVDLNLLYDPNLIDSFISITNVQPDSLTLGEQNQDTPGTLILKFTENKADLIVENGKSAVLATMIVHLNQQATAKRKLKLFSWTAEQNRAWDRDQDVTGRPIDPDIIYLEPSLPPDFKGLSTVSSANLLGVKDPGNTLVLDWRTAAGYDRTKFYTDKLSYRIWRKIGATEWQELPTTQPAADQTAAPSTRTPYTGNGNSDYLFEDTGLEDGVSYQYKVSALDDTSPQPNENVGTAILGGTPFDFTPPGEVLFLTAEAGEHLVNLSWQNPSDPDLGGVVIIKREGSPIPNTALGKASATGGGPEYQVGTEPFGPGPGQIVFISDMSDSPASVPNQFTDYEAKNSQPTDYRVYAFDRERPAGGPREFGRNYSSGQSVAGKAGIAPRPVADFKAGIGEKFGELKLTWDNSPDDFCAGVLIRYTDDESKKFAALGDERKGKLLWVFPNYDGPNELDGYFVSGLKPGKTYYFMAFALNWSDIEAEFDPTDPASLARHCYSSGQTASFTLPSDPAAYTVPAAAAQEPRPRFNVWFDDLPYDKVKGEQGDFHVSKRPRGRVIISVDQPYRIDQNRENYQYSLDNAPKKFDSVNLTANQAILEFTLPADLTPDIAHLMAFTSQTAGTVATATIATETVKIKYTQGKLALIGNPLGFPNPFYPEKHKSMFIEYNLAQAANINLLIFGLTNQIVYNARYANGENGGKEGLNKVAWNGMTNQGAPVGNGLYVAQIISRDDNRPLGKVKFMVYR